MKISRYVVDRNIGGNPFVPPFALRAIEALDATPEFDLCGSKLRRKFGKTMAVHVVHFEPKGVYPFLADNLLYQFYRLLVKFYSGA